MAPPNRKRIAWLLAFVASDLTSQSAASLRKRRKNFTNLIRYAGHTVGLTLDQWRAADAAILTDLQQRIRTGIDVLTNGGTWRPFPHDGPAPHWEVERQANGIVRRFWWADWKTIAVAAAADVLMDWWHQLRRCPTCGVLFLPHHGGQEYHDPRCSARTRYQRFKSHRDYRAEYEKRKMQGSDGDPHAAIRRRRRDGET